ncbi:hypothetical protein [Pseudomonas viridiflava]|nr:hypothetical protein [Pseudomonas viridiflava]
MTRNDKQMELKAWHLLLEDDTYRLDLPDDFIRPSSVGRTSWCCAR